VSLAATEPAQLAALLEIVSARPLLRRKDLARRYGIALATVDRWHAAGLLPPAIYLNGCSIPLWRPGDLLNWEAEGCTPMLPGLG
jgi:predicted DNA-binding transcriptional regulator AlpA